MTNAEREIVVSLRLELEQRLRGCVACGGSGQLSRSRRACPLCRRAVEALQASDAMLRSEQVQGSQGRRA
jgi:hypothetical protein